MKKNNVKFKGERKKKLQDPCSVLSGYEQSLKRAQWQIYKAKLEGKAACVHKLQERLCQSFCAKFLATEYAIITLQLNGGKLPSSRVFKSCLRWRAHEHLFVPWVYASNSTAPKEIQYNSKQEPFSAKVWSRKQEEEKSIQRAFSKCNQYTKRQKAATQVSEGWKIFIAQSLWERGGGKNSNEREISLNRGRGAQEECLYPLEQSFVARIREEARQVHAIFALEPEWQALFSCLERGKNEFVANTKSKSGQNGVACEYVTEFCERSGLRSPKQALKKIKTELHTRSPQFVLIGSVDKYLSAVNHQIVIDRLETFRTMEEKIRVWLKKISVSDNILSSPTYTPPVLQGSHLGKRDMHVFKHVQYMQNQDEYLCPLVRTHSFVHRVVNSDHSFQRSFRAQRVCAWPTTQFLLYSCFPHVLWEEHPVVHDVTQIEDHANCKHDIVARFLSRVLLYDLVEKVQKVAQNLSCSRDVHTCTRDAFVLQSLRENPSKKDCYCGVRQEAKQVDPIIEEKSIDLPRKENKDACALNGSKQLDSTSISLCIVSRNRFIIIHPNKRFLEECAEKVQDYLEKILSHNQYILPDLKTNTERLFPSQANHTNPCQVVENTSFLCKNNLLVFKKESGLNIQKSVVHLQIKDCRQGFLLFGFQINQIADVQNKALHNSYTCKVIPWQRSVESIALLIKSRVKQSRSASTNVLINRLNLLLSHWIEYYSEHEYVHSYNKLSSLVWGNLRSWFSHRKPKKK